MIKGVLLFAAGGVAGFLVARHTGLLEGGLETGEKPSIVTEVAEFFQGLQPNFVGAMDAIIKPTEGSGCC